MEYVGYTRTARMLPNTEPLLEVYSADQESPSAGSLSSLGPEYFGSESSSLYAACEDVTGRPDKYGLPLSLSFEDRYSTYGIYLEETHKLEQLASCAVNALERAAQFKKEERGLSLSSTTSSSAEDSSPLPRPRSGSDELRALFDKSARKEAERQRDRAERLGRLYDKIAYAALEAYGRLTDPDVVMYQNGSKSQEVRSGVAFSLPSQQGYIDSVKTVATMHSDIYHGDLLL